MTDIATIEEAIRVGGIIILTTGIVGITTIGITEAATNPTNGISSDPDFTNKERIYAAMNTFCGAKDNRARLAPEKGSSRSTVLTC